MTERVNLGALGREYLTKSIRNLVGFGSTLTDRLSKGQVYTVLPTALVPSDLCAGGVMSQGVGIEVLRQEVARLAQPGDLLVLQDVWAKRGDHPAPDDNCFVAPDGGIYFWVEASFVESQQIRHLLRKSTSYLWIFFLLGKECREFIEQNSFDVGRPLEAIKLLAISAFDQEGFVFWQPADERRGGAWYGELSV